MHWLPAAAFVVVGLLFIGISIPLILRRVPPNRVYGFRVSKTLENSDIWYDANECSGKWLAGAGAVIVLAAIALGALEMPPQSYAIAMVAVTMVSGGIALAASLVHLSTL